MLFLRFRLDTDTLNNTIQTRWGSLGGSRPSQMGRTATTRQNLPIGNTPHQRKLGTN